jgi:4F5 protein related disordered region
MTRGNQRDEARLKNAKDALGKGVKKEGSYLLRKEADSNALADKVDR